MVAWRAPSLVSDVAANRAHGNTVTSLVVHGSSWNTHLKLPELVCRVGIAQAIANVNQGSATCAEFESYLKATVERHSGSTKVWNLSFNQPIEPDAPHEMSSLGHELHKISRRFGILPIVSVGNTDHCSTMRTCPPADCEAALTVGEGSQQETRQGNTVRHAWAAPDPKDLRSRRFLGSPRFVHWVVARRQEAVLLQPLYPVSPHIHFTICGMQPQTWYAPCF